MTLNLTKKTLRWKCSNLYSYTWMVAGWNASPGDLWRVPLEWTACCIHQMDSSISSVRCASGGVDRVCLMLRRPSCILRPCIGRVVHPCGTSCAASIDTACRTCGRIRRMHRRAQSHVDEHEHVNLCLSVRKMSSYIPDVGTYTKQSVVVIAV